MVPRPLQKLDGDSKDPLCPHPHLFFHGHPLQRLKPIQGLMQKNGTN